MNTLIAMIVLLVLTSLFWAYACAENTARVRAAIRSAIEFKNLIDRPQLRRDFYAVSATEHFKREVLLRNPLVLYGPRIQRMCAEELSLEHPR